MCVITSQINKLLKKQSKKKIDSEKITHTDLVNIGAKWQ